MSFRSSLDTKELVRQAIDIVDLVGKYVQLRRSGRRYVGLCPWHEDTRPSLQVNPERQSFKCWVCDIGGDIFSFVMKMEGVEFREALGLLADQAGVEIQPSRPPAPIPGPDQPAPAEASGGGKRRLLQAMAWAEQQYHRCLVDSPEAEPARAYLADRGITDASIRTFHLGYSPNQRDWLLERARQANATVEILQTVGILVRPPGGGPWYDRFRGRLLFSIRDPLDRPVGLGGRVLPGSTNPAKYVNSPETPLFSKSSLLYGLDAARDAIRKSRTAVVVEGYTDCIVAHQHGFRDVVAVLGTALGDRQIRTLKRYADRIVLVLDGDEAGQRRANEVLELFVAEKVDLRIVTLPAGRDPADFLGEHGPEAFGDLLRTRAVDALEHALETHTRGIDLAGDVHGASEALERLVAIVAKAPRLRPDTTAADRFREEKILQRLAARFRVTEGSIRRRLTELRRAARRGSARRSAPEASKTPPGRPPRGRRIAPIERELLEILLQHPALLPAMRREVASDQLSEGPCRQVFQVSCRLADAGIEPTFERLMLEFDDPALKSLLVELDEQGRAKGGPAPEALLAEVIRSFRRQEADRQRPLRAGALREGGMDEPEQRKLLADIVQQARTRHGISEPTDG